MSCQGFGAQGYLSLELVSSRSESIAVAHRSLRRHIGAKVVVLQDAMAAGGGAEEAMGISRMVGSNCGRSLGLRYSLLVNICLAYTRPWVQSSVLWGGEYFEDTHQWGIYLLSIPTTRSGITKA